ncbi:MAG: prepilin-type N-terminal cleavage/methylation domain-containing protein [Gammaproteobacteria bacterium]|nr:prepilin-type N-terminal cleavage/methylation domain-containing protein [Gammaproteobacteria bacterium]
MYKRQSGFTLVEIAIVLVIIGLLLGGVLKGQEMIANARYKSLQSDIEAYKAAFFAFQDRFGALPGDFTLASTRLNAAAPNGSAADVGNITGATCSAATDESCYVWQHLRFANLISGAPTLTSTNANPTHAYGSTMDGMFTATINGRAGVWLSVEGVPADAAARYDRELDDGVGNTGLVNCNTGCAAGVYPLNTNNISLRVNIM